MSIDPDNPYRISSLSSYRSSTQPKYSEDRRELEPDNKIQHLSQSDIDHDLDEYPEEERQNE